MSFPQAVEQGLEELKQALAGVYGERLKGVYLYGSYPKSVIADKRSCINEL